MSASGSGDSDNDNKGQYQADSSSNVAKKRKVAADTSSSYEQKWNNMFERLKAYKNKHGHCRVPNRYPDDPQLGNWVSTQRRQYRILTTEGNRSVPLTLERARQLQSLGFEWSAKDPTFKSWEDRFIELKSFQDKYGHTIVPLGWKENPRLAAWVSTQRQEYKLLKQGHSSRLNEAKAKELDRIGFTWEAPRGRRRLEDILESTDRQHDDENTTQNAPSLHSHSGAETPIFNMARPTSSFQGGSAIPADTFHNMPFQVTHSSQRDAAPSPLQGRFNPPLATQEQLLQFMQLRSETRMSGVQEQKVDPTFPGQNAGSEALPSIQALQLPGSRWDTQRSSNEGSAPSMRDRLFNLMQAQNSAGPNPIAAASRDHSGMALRISHQDQLTQALQILYGNVPEARGSGFRSLSQDQLASILQRRNDAEFSNRASSQRRPDISSLLTSHLDETMALRQREAETPNLTNTQRRLNLSPLPASYLDESLSLRQAQDIMSNASTQQLENIASLYANLRETDGISASTAAAQTASQEAARLLGGNSLALRMEAFANVTNRDVLLEALLRRFAGSTVSQQQQSHQGQSATYLPDSSAMVGQHAHAAGLNASGLVLGATTAGPISQTENTPGYDWRRQNPDSRVSMLQSQATRSQQSPQQEGKRGDSDDSEDKKPAAKESPNKRQRDS